MRTNCLTDLQFPPRAHVCKVHKTLGQECQTPGGVSWLQSPETEFDTPAVGCPIPHFRVQKGARERPPCGRYAPSIRTSAEPALGQAPQYTST